MIIYIWLDLYTLDIPIKINTVQIYIHRYIFISYQSLRQVTKPVSREGSLRNNIWCPNFCKNFHVAHSLKMFYTWRDKVQIDYLQMQTVCLGLLVHLSEFFASKVSFPGEGSTTHRTHISHSNRSSHKYHSCALMLGLV